jgi:hypothetical protein
MLMQVCLPARALSSTVFCCLLGSALTAVAGDWQFNPRIELGGEFNDNYRLFPSPNQDRVYGFFTNTALQLRYLTPVDELSLTPSVYGVVLPDSRVDNTADPSAVFNWNRTAQTYKAGLYAQYLNQSVVEANETTAGTIGNQLGNPTPGDTGLSTQRERRQLTEATPTLTIDLTQRQHLQAGGAYNYVTYSKNLPGFSVGYRSIDGNLGIVEDVTQRVGLSIRGVVTQYNPRGGFPSSTSYGGMGEWDYHTSQVSKAYIMGGAERTRFATVANVPYSPPTTSVVAGAGMNWTFQVTQIFLDLTRTVEPNGTGYTVNRDQARLSLARQLSPKFTGEIGTRLDRDRPTSPTILLADRDYAVGYLTAKWRFLRAWTLTGEYDYTFQRFGAQRGRPAVPATATTPAVAALAAVPAVDERSNRVVLSIIWEPNRIN